MKPDYTYRAKVVKVYDGDTVTVDIDFGMDQWKHNEKIRLYGLDTPEVRGVEKPEGLKVRDWLRSQILGKDVIIKTIKDKKGKYGRYLGIVYLGARCINDELLQKPGVVPLSY